MREGNGKLCIIIVTSDKGLAGSLNSGVIRKVEHMIFDRDLKKEDIVFIGIGRRGADHFANRGYEVRMKIENLAEDVSEVAIRSVTNKLIEWHAAGEVAGCIVAYQNFITTFEQEPTVRHIVPITAFMMGEMVAGIRPARGKYAPAEKSDAVHTGVYTIEPDADTVLAQLLPRLLNVAVFM